jgi:catechol 2,3-dioxygenase-like lactoylglutathione lyase family enzyme
VIQHVTLEVRHADAAAEARFWQLLGFVALEPPASLAHRSLWLGRGGTQIHLAYTRTPVIPSNGHVAVLSEEFDAAVAALRAAGHPVEPRSEHWGAARAYTRSPAGHLVELMAGPPPG